jgi:hypothetical protein
MTFDSFFSQWDTAKNSPTNTIFFKNVTVHGAKQAFPTFSDHLSEFPSSHGNGHLHSLIHTLD